MKNLNAFTQRNILKTLSLSLLATILLLSNLLAYNDLNNSQKNCIKIFNNSKLIVKITTSPVNPQSNSFQPLNAFPIGPETNYQIDAESNQFIDPNEFIAQIEIEDLRDITGKDKNSPFNSLSQTYPLRLIEEKNKHILIDDKGARYRCMITISKDADAWLLTIEDLIPVY